MSLARRMRDRYHSVCVCSCLRGRVCAQEARQGRRITAGRGCASGKSAAADSCNVRSSWPWRTRTKTGTRRAFGLQRLKWRREGGCCGRPGDVDARNSSIGSGCCAAVVVAAGLRGCGDARCKMHDGCTAKASGGSSCLSGTFNSPGTGTGTDCQDGVFSWLATAKSVPLGGCPVGEFGRPGCWLVEIRRRPQRICPAPVALAKPPQRPPSRAGVIVVLNLAAKIHPSPTKGPTALHSFFVSKLYPKAGKPRAPSNQHSSEKGWIA